MAPTPPPLDSALAALVHEELGQPLAAFVASVCALAERLTAAAARGPVAKQGLGDGLARAAGGPVAPAVPVAARPRPPRRPGVRAHAGAAVRAVPGDVEVASTYAEVPSPLPATRVWIRRKGEQRPLAPVAPDGGVAPVGDGAASE